jgi:ABC-2 type transport system ATP-binding protein
MITIKNLSKSFEHIQALNDVSFMVEKGSLCGLLGPNGAGKSTLFKILMGLLAPDDGEIELIGTHVTFGESEYKRQIGYAPETAILYEYLTGHEFLQFIATAKQLPPALREEQIQHWLAFFDLTAKANELIKGYSHGMRRKISLSAALLGAPAILLFDEATNFGYNPIETQRLIKMFFAK